MPGVVHSSAHPSFPNRKKDDRPQAIKAGRKGTRLWGRMAGTSRVGMHSSLAKKNCSDGYALFVAFLLQSRTRSRDEARLASSQMANLPPKPRRFCHLAIKYDLGS